MAGRRSRLDTDVYPPNYVDPPLRKNLPYWQQPQKISYAANGSWVEWASRHAKGARAAYTLPSEFSKHPVTPNVQGLRAQCQHQDTTTNAFAGDQPTIFYQSAPGVTGVAEVNFRRSEPERRWVRNQLIL